MKASTLTPAEVFGNQIRYVIQLYQRPLQFPEMNSYHSALFNHLLSQGHLDPRGDGATDEGCKNSSRRRATPLGRRRKLELSVANETLGP